MESEIASGIIVGLVVVFIIVVVFGMRWFARRGNLTHIYSATSELYTKDKKKPIEYVIETKAKKKMEEQESGQDK